MNKFLASVAAVALLSASAAFAVDEPAAAPGTTPTAMEAAPAAKADTASPKKHTAKKHTGKHKKKASSDSSTGSAQ